MPVDPDPFDHAYATATADACDLAAARLAEARRGQAADAAAAVHDWLGPHRDHFDRELARSLRGAERVEASLRHLAEDLRTASRRERARA